jgi:sigma-B regulation protein RsbU (phosphoserine phosphatase)
MTEIEILLEASEAAAAHSLDFDALMDALATLVRKIVDYELYSVLLPNEDGELQIAHSVGYSETLARSLRIPVGEGLTGQAVRSRATVRVDDVNREAGYLRVVESVQSEVAVPLVARGRVVAVLDLQSADPNAFDSRVSDLLELVSSRFSLAIDCAQLYHSQKKQHSTLRTLQQIAQEFSQILQLGELLQEISTLVRTLIRYDVLAIYLTDPNRPLLRHYFGVKFEERVQWSDIGIGEGLVGEAARTREPVMVRETSQDPRYIESMPGIRSEVAIPLLLKNEMIGVLDLESVRPSRFSAADVRTLMLLAPQIAAAIENARLYEEKALSEARLESDLVAARALQSHMLPEGKRKAPRLEIAARNEPAAVVSGDFYDFYDLGQSIGILNGDVSGKGSAAALYAALASGLIRTAVGMGGAPGETLGRINDSLVDRKLEARYLAAFLAYWNAPQQRLTMSGAGMPFPYVSRQGRLDRIPLEGVPLGLFRGIAYDEVALELEPGDFAVTVSDGFSDSLNADGESYGEDRLLRVLAAHLSEPAETVLDRIFEDVGRFSEGCAPADDRTAVVLRVTD